MKLPSYFSSVKPRCSVYGRCEVEDIAFRIVRVLSRKGNKWRQLSWEEWDSDTGDLEMRSPEWFEREWFFSLSELLVSESGARGIGGFWRRL